jgi:hypothetical protein
MTENYFGPAVGKAPSGRLTDLLMERGSDISHTVDIGQFFDFKLMCSNQLLN